MSAALTTAPAEAQERRPTVVNLVTGSPRFSETFFVSTDVTGIPEVVRDGETGPVVGQHDPKALAAALGRSIQDAAAARNRAGEARCLIESEYDAAKNAARSRRVFGHHANNRVRAGGAS